MSNPIPKLPWNIYWINLDRRPDRKKHMTQILTNNKENSHRIKAIDYKNNYQPYNVIKHPKLNKGEHGCTCSHIVAMSYFLDNSDDDFCFIVEDDLLDKYSPYWQPMHYDILKSKYDMVQLQLNNHVYNNFSLKLEKNYGTGTAIYKISRKLAKYFVQLFLNKDTMTIDLSKHASPIADHLLYNKDTYVIPMFTVLDVTDSDTAIYPNGEKELDPWSKQYYNNIKNKHLQFWKAIV